MLTEYISQMLLDGGIGPYSESIIIGEILTDLSILFRYVYLKILKNKVHNAYFILWTGGNWKFCWLSKFMSIMLCSSMKLSKDLKSKFHISCVLLTGVQTVLRISCGFQISRSFEFNLFSSSDNVEVRGFLRHFHTGLCLELGPLSGHWPLPGGIMELVWGCDQSTPGRGGGRSAGGYVWDFHRAAGKVRTWPEHLLVHHFKAGQEWNLCQACVYRAYRTGWASGTRRLWN